MMGTKIVAILVACALLGATWGCAEDTASASPPPQGTAQQLLLEVAEAYRAAPALTDEFRFEMRFRGESRVDTRTLASGPDAAVRLDIDGFVFTAVDEQVYVYRADRPAKYFEIPLAGNLPATYRDLTNGMTLPVPQLVMRYGRGPEDYLPALGMQVVGNLKLSGRDEHKLLLTGDAESTVTVSVSPKTRFIEKIEIAAGPVSVTATMSAKRLDRLPEAITFDVTGRRRVEDMMQVVSLSKGDPAPDFTLPTLAGESVTLSDRRGSMVVVDFWATWCMPCKMGLPKLQQFQDWARAEGMSVDVVPVNMGERLRTNEDKRNHVQKYWKSQGFTMRTLMDYDNSTAMAFDVGPIPHTVVVGPDGVILHVEIGFKPNLSDTLKQMAKDLKISGKDT
jgi:thiol-disulfide isomerase/thioredoxin